MHLRIACENEALSKAMLLLFFPFSFFRSHQKPFLEIGHKSQSRNCKTNTYNLREVPTVFERVAPTLTIEFEKEEARTAQSQLSSIYSAKVVLKSIFYWLSAKAVFFKAWYWPNIFTSNLESIKKITTRILLAWTWYRLLWRDLWDKEWIEMKFKDDFRYFSRLLNTYIINWNWRESKCNQIISVTKRLQQLQWLFLIRFI